MAQVFRPRVRWIVGPVVFILALGAAAALAEPAGLPKWFAVPAAAVATAAAELIGRPWLDRRRQAAQTDQAAVDELRRHLGRQGGLTTVAAADPLMLGVHPSVSPPQADGSAPIRAERPARAPAGVRGRTGHDPDLPQWVERDVAPGIRRWLAEASATGGFLLLVGDSSVGKTRLLYDAVAEVLPRWSVLAPDPGDGNLVNLVAEATFELPNLVVWLDELQRFVEGPYLTEGSTGVTAGSIRRLLDARTPVIVVGTLWPEHARALRAVEVDPATGQQRLSHPRAADVLDQRRRHEITVETMNADECRVAARRAGEDPRLAVAVEDPDFGPTEVLAGAPELVRRFDQLSPPARAVVVAAIDARRLGVQTPLHDALLRDLARAYLPTPQPDDRWFPPALQEATEVRRAVAPLLVVPTADRRAVLGHVVADYLQQYGQRRRTEVVPPDLAWNALAQHLHDPADLGRLATSAYNRLLLGHAEALLRCAMAAGDPEVYRDLSTILQEQGRLHDAEQVLLEASAQGELFAPLALLILLNQQGDRDAAMRAMQDSVAAGEPGGPLAMAALLSAADRVDDAIDVLRQAVAAGMPHAPAALALFLQDHGRPDEAEAAYRAAVATDKEAYGELAALLANQGRYDDAVEVWRAAIAVDAEEAHRGLAHLFAEQDRTGDAEAVWQNAIAAGVPTAYRGLAELHLSLGRADDAERDWRDAIANGDPAGYQGLADLLESQGRTDELEPLLWEALAAGADVHRRLSDLLMETGREREADEVLLAGIAAGEVGYYSALAGPRMYSPGRTAEAEEYLRSGMAAGDRAAVGNLVSMLLAADRQDEVEPLLRKAVASGFPGAGYQLISYLDGTGRPEEAAGLSRFGLRPDGEPATD